jgi:hypothetical protein
MDSVKLRQRFADGSAEQPANQGNLLAEAPASAEQPAAALPESTPAAQSFYANSASKQPPPLLRSAVQPATKSSAPKSSAAQPALNVKRDILAPLNALCVRNEPIPRTQHDDRLLRIPWPPLAGFRDNIASAVPTFYPDEPDSNQGDKPRLDILFTMHDGGWVRYHPSAEPIWSHGPLPTDAMTKRYNRARKIARQHAVQPV